MPAITTSPLAFHINTHGPTGPWVPVDKPPGQWSRLRILKRGDPVTILPNGQRVVKNLPLEKDWGHRPPLIPNGPIELQANTWAVSLKNLDLRPL